MSPLTFDWLITVVGVDWGWGLAWGSFCAVLQQVFLGVGHSLNPQDWIGPINH